MDFESNYEVARVADFIHSGEFTRVALQFPDELLKDSVRVASAIREKLRFIKLQNDVHERNGIVNDVSLYVMADTTYGSCCVDEVGAAHANAQCVIHYGHTCLSPTSTLPALFVFGKAPIDVSCCVEKLQDYVMRSTKAVLVLYGLEYAHVIPQIRERFITESSRISNSLAPVNLEYADVMCSIVSPTENFKMSNRRMVGGEAISEVCNGVTSRKHNIGGLTWSFPPGHQIEDYSLFWIGSDNPAFSNIVLSFNSCEIARYDAAENCLLTDFYQQKRILKRRYYLVEKAKDANIVGILIGTLGVAGYLHVIHRMKELITGAGKKAYTLVMGKPNPAKLANFPECDVFIYVSCAQTALLDSKEFLAPVITPFEAMLAFNRGSQWTGQYFMGFEDLLASSQAEVSKQIEEARFSFLQGGYVEDFEPQEVNEEENDRVLALVNATEKALQVRDKESQTITKGTAKSGAEFFAARSYHGLDIHNDNSCPEPFLIGRSGRASGYEDEKTKQR